MAVELSDTDLEIRRGSWREIRNIVTNKSLSPHDQLRMCLNVASTYAALTGDDSLFPKQIRQEHVDTVAWLKKNLDKIERRKEAKARDKASGQDSLFEAE